MRSSRPWPISALAGLQRVGLQQHAHRPATPQGQGGVRWCRPRVWASDGGDAADRHAVRRTPPGPRQGARARIGGHAGGHGCPGACGGEMGGGGRWGGDGRAALPACSSQGSSGELCNKWGNRRLASSWQACGCACPADPPPASSLTAMRPAPPPCAGSVAAGGSGGLQHLGGRLRLPGHD